MIKLYRRVFIIKVQNRNQRMVNHLIRITPRSIIHKNYKRVQNNLENKFPNHKSQQIQSHHLKTRIPFTKIQFHLKTVEKG